MADKVPPRIPAGMRDILPAQMIKRQYVLDIVRTIFERYGFEPLQTSAVELSETLMGKYGEEAERLIYKAWYGDTPGDEFSLRYDLSVPLCRVVAMYPELPRPFKRYQIAPVWRADRPQRGRYREFFQCDVDIVGSASMLADAEIVALAYEVLTGLGFSEFTIAINNRKILDGIGQYAGVPETLQAGLYRSIDKLDKIGMAGVRSELLMVGVPGQIMEPLQRIARLAIQGKLPFEQMRDRMIASSDQGGEGLPTGLADAILEPLQEQVRSAIERQIAPGELQAATRALVMELSAPLRRYYSTQTDIIPDEVVDRLLGLLQIKGSNQQILDDLAGRLSGYPRAIEGINELRELFGGLEAMGVPSDICQISFAMVRGLEYYTGPIFEITVEKPKAMPSITGGGRYDELIGLFADRSYPATGISFGIERIIDAMDELGMFPAELNRTTAEVLVTTFSRETAAASLQTAARLRQAGINTTVYFEADDRLGTQIGYASALGIPFVVILGPDEIAAGTVTLRKLGKTREDSAEQTIAQTDLPEAIRAWRAAR